MKNKRYTNATLFTGEEVLTDHDLLVVGDKIAGIIPNNESTDNYEVIDLEGLNIAPAFLDLQIYGGGGSLFNTNISEETIERTLAEVKLGGASRIQITLSSVPLADMLEAIRVCKNYVNSGKKGLLALHLEGPYFNPNKRGAHKAAFVREPTRAELEQILEAADDLPLYMTIAPEMFSNELLDFLLKSPIKLAAGHSNATYAQAKRAFDRGITRVTHLFNAMSQFQSREPGLLGATYDSDVSASIIADGIHVDFNAIRISKKMMGERLFLITDAVTNDQRGDYKFTFSGDRFVDENGTLSGSALTMIQAVENCVKKVGIPLAEALRMASTYPARVIGKDDCLGYLKKGYWAEFVVFDNELKIKG